jgi:hypothetical protein
LPVDDQRWFQQWWQEGKYGEFEKAFREKYGTTIAFGEFNKYLNEFKFNEDMGAIKNARRLRDHTRSVIALLARDSDKERAEWALLEFFKDRLDPHDARQIAGEHKDEEVKTLDKYMEYIQALERKSGTMVLIRKEGNLSRITGYKPEGVGEYDAYEQQQQEKKKPKKNINVILPQGYGIPNPEVGAVPTTSQQYPAANTGPPGYHQVPPPQQYGGNTPKPANAAPAPNQMAQGRNNNGYQGGVQCTFCNYYGHTEDNCRGKRRAMNLPPEPNWKCRRCNMMGHHYTADCPSRPRDPQTTNGPEQSGGVPGGQPMPLTQHNPQLVRILQGQTNGTATTSEGNANLGSGMYLPQGGGSPMIMTLAAQPAGVSNLGAQPLYQVQPIPMNGGGYQLQAAMPANAPAYNAQAAYIAPEQGYNSGRQWQAPNGGRGGPKRCFACNGEHLVRDCPMRAQFLQGTMPGNQQGP